MVFNKKVILIYEALYSNNETTKDSLAKVLRQLKVILKI
jgi:hypothetical protein